LLSIINHMRVVNRWIIITDFALRLGD